VRNGRGDSQQLSPSSPSDNDTQLHADLRSLPSPNQIPSANGTGQHRWERDFQPSNNPGQASAGDRFDSSRYAAPDLVTRLGQQPPAMNSNFLCKSTPGIQSKVSFRPSFLTFCPSGPCSTGHKSKRHITRIFRINHASRSLSRPTCEPGSTKLGIIRTEYSSTRPAERRAKQHYFPRS